MMKRHLFLILAFSALSASAQVNSNEPAAQPVVTSAKTTATAPVALHFGYFSYQAAFESLPDYAIARRDLDELRGKYQTEMKRVEDEFNQKYELFLEGQRDFAPSILHKRQAELQEMMDKNVTFKQEAQRLLKEAEEKAYQPLRNKLAAALQKVGKEKGLAFILNTDSNAVPFIDPLTGINVQTDIEAAAK